MFVFEFTTLALVGGAVLLILFGVLSLVRPFLYHTTRIVVFTIGFPLILLWWVWENTVELSQRLYRAIACRSASKNSSAKS